MGAREEMLVALAHTPVDLEGLVTPVGLGRTLVGLVEEVRSRSWVFAGEKGDWGRMGHKHRTEGHPLAQNSVLLCRRKCPRKRKIGMGPLQVVGPQAGPKWALPIFSPVSTSCQQLWPLLKFLPLEAK